MSDLDEIGLARWFRSALPAAGELKAVTKFPGGQSNPTYRVETGDDRLVLRRKPFGPLLPSAHSIEREYRLISALHPTGFTVPRPVALCEDSAVIGAPFYLMELVDGRIFPDGTLPDVDTADRGPLYDAAIDTIAALHSVDFKAVGLGDFGPPGNYVGRQVQRWTRQYRAAQTDDLAEVERLIAWLPQTIPEQTHTSIIHGDYRIDNLVYAPDAPRVRAILDWELATIGDPLADFAYFAMQWVIPHDGRWGLDGIDLRAAGLPTLDAVVARYCAATGRAALPELNWYFAYNMFRLIGILQGVKKRIADGSASNANAAALVAGIPSLAIAAWAAACRAGASK